MDEANLEDYGVSLGTVTLPCDNESAIKITNNLVHHCRNKHIDIRHHFLRDHVANKDINLTHVGTTYNWRIFSLSLWMKPALLT